LLISKTSPCVRFFRAESAQNGASARWVRGAEPTVSI
jgi:hypothetical protein